MQLKRLGISARIREKESQEEGKGMNGRKVKDGERTSTVLHC
jgi:hypothetical protein